MFSTSVADRIDVEAGYTHCLGLSHSVEFDQQFMITSL
jgi:hypothetical protein